jgi:uncharacterized glyoxalase superfamily protein PhnB
MPVPQLDALGIVVSDMPRALAFYRQLGLTFPDGADQESHVETTLPNGLRLMFDTIEVIERFTTYVPPAGGHRMGMAFLCASPEEVDATHASLIAGGAESAKAPWDAFWGQRYAQVFDADHNPVDLFASLPADG